MTQPEQLFPEPTVGALIFDPAGRLFLMRSHKWGGKYVVPGGHVELGETLEVALRREVAEETGLSIRDITFVGGAGVHLRSSLLAAPAFSLL